MLSEHEYQKTKQQLANISGKLSIEQQSNLRKTLRKKLHEHELASTYPEFRPLPYQQFFINHTTHELTLLHLIESVQSSKRIILDTESFNVPHQNNEPALIQLQLILPTSYSYIILVEVRHLPPQHDPTFNLIKLFFDTLFNHEKRIYIWGEIDELVSFVKFKLFSNKQIYLSTNINCQKEFKSYWQKKYPHKVPLNVSTEDSQCKCESCLGIKPNDSWSLQNAVAYELNLWLNKQYTRSQFQIGLDPTLKHLNDKEFEHRQLSTRYASHDCLSIHQILLKLNYFNEQTTQNELELILSVQPDSPLTPPENHAHEESLMEWISDEDEDNNIIVTNEPTVNRTIIFDTSTTNNLSLNQSNSYELNKPKYENELSIEERKKIHNHTCTIKQRQRYYKDEISVENIDNRFIYRQIKKILRDKGIPVSAVIKSKSRTSKEITLHIGLKDINKLNRYKATVANLFSKEHYEEMKHSQTNRRRRR